jgi:hypothetical protein
MMMGEPALPGFGLDPLAFLAGRDLGTEVDVGDGGMK